MLDNLDFGVIGNCRSAALISRAGSLEWLCLPDFDSPGLFAGLLDEEQGGRFSFVVAPEYEITQEYLSGTNILRTVFENPESAFEVIDFMPRYHTRSSECYMPPEVYRVLRPLKGRPRLKINYDPRPNYARYQPVHSIQADCIRTAALEDDRDDVFLYASFVPDDILAGREIVLEKEEFLLLSHHRKLIDINMDWVRLVLNRTMVYWMNWNTRSVQFKQYNRYVSRSLLVLKLMSYEKTGAILAALTTSLPEVLGGERNWDYRFCWLRDASMSLNTLMRMGHKDAARGFLNFIRNIIIPKQADFQIVYGIRGERTLTEEILDHLAGYAGSRPVRVGNAAYDQRQNDALGYLLDIIYSYYRFFPGPVNDLEEMWEIVQKAVKTVQTMWLEPDRSIWEFRGRNDHFVFSKIMCWVTLDRAAQIAVFLGKVEDEQFFRRAANEIKTDIYANGWNERIQSFSQSYGSDHVDASLLLMERYGFIEADEPRFIKTVDRIKNELFYDGLMYRYKNADDFGRQESAFTICAFWLVRALYVTGRKEEAVKLFEELLPYGNHVDLFSEDLDFASKRRLGNFPQAYSHLALIEIVELISEKKFRSSWIEI